MSRGTDDAQRACHGAGVGCGRLLRAGIVGSARAAAVHAEEKGANLEITTAAGRRILVPRSERRKEDQRPVSFGKVAISSDRRAVGWVAYYENCCTSYPIPTLLEVYRAGKRYTFEPAILPWHWCFLDGSDTVAAVSTTAHSAQGEVIERWDILTGRRRGRVHLDVRTRESRSALVGAGRSPESREKPAHLPVLDQTVTTL